MATEAGSIHDDVRDYYGKQLQCSADLKTNACTTNMSGMPKYVKEALAMVHIDVVSKYYGCGLVAPECLENMHVLDLGSGSGQDCYVLSKLVGEEGHVTGVDMTEEQLETAKKYIDHHTELYGYSKPNVDFVKGYLEKLDEAGLKDNTFDILISNCVVNLVPDKRQVLKEAYRVLKEGGEMYFSDVYADCDLPEEVRKHKVLWGECISGALYWKDLVKLAAEIGFSTPRLVSAAVMDITNKELEAVVGDAKFVSATYRLFTMPKKHEKSALVMYEGSVTGFPDRLLFDHTVTFETGKETCVSEEVATILKTSRFKDDFTFGQASCSTVSAQTMDDMDPFKLLTASTSGGNASGQGSCCAPGSKSANQKSGCC